MKRTSAAKNTRTSSDISQRLFTVNFGTKNSDIFPRAHEMSFEDLANRFRIPDLRRGQLPLSQYLALDKSDRVQKKLADAEKNGEYFLMAALKNGGKRNDANVECMTGFVGDIDTGKISKEQLMAILAGYMYIAYSSYSHSEVTPKWRFILFYSEPATVYAHKRVYAFLQRLFDNQLDKRCETPSQLWYTPACPPDAGGIYEFFTGEGELLDSVEIARSDDALPSVPAAAVSKTQLALNSSATARTIPVDEYRRLSEALCYIDADDRSDWIKVGLALKHKYDDAGEVLWKAWSQKSAKYDVVDADNTWTSLKPRETEGVTLGTIFHMAAQNGYANQLVTANMQQKQL